jgi:hypothetical protein
MATGLLAFAVAITFGSVSPLHPASALGFGAGAAGTATPAEASCGLSVDNAARADGPLKSLAPDGVAPDRLSGTGLYLNTATREIHPGNLPYTPQYPLWSDGASKHRWIHIPEGTAIDASSPDVWSFPVGTKFWKEFSLGSSLETRYMERRPDGGWLFASYVWAADGSDAFLAPSKGTRDVPAQPAGTRWAIPGYYDCLSCHEGRPGRVLGFTALQLSAERDTLAPHATPPDSGSIDLTDLIEDRLLVNAPEDWRTNPPRVPADTPRARAALGYLYSNCAMCHNASGPLSVLDFSLDVSVVTRQERDLPVFSTAVDQPAKVANQGMLRISSGAPEKSWLLARMQSPRPSERMPPLGSAQTDSIAVRLVAEWIAVDLPTKPMAPLSARRNGH